MLRLNSSKNSRIAAFLFVIATFSVTAIIAQSAIFSRQFKSAGTEAYVITHLATSEGGTLILTDQRKVSTGLHYMDIVKTDLQGTVEWTKRFGPMNFGLKNVVQSPDSSYFLCFSQNPFGHFYQMIKLDPNGNILFDKRVDFPAALRVGIFPMSIARNDGGYYVACSITDTTTYVTTWHVFSIDADGNLIWSNGYNSDAFTMEVTTIDTTANGDIVLAGTFFDLTQQKYEIIVTRINSSGTLLWSKNCVSVGIYDYYPREITHSGNEIILTAVAYNSVAVTSSTVLIKFSSSGNVLWSNRYENTTSQIDPFDVVVVENNNLAITGTANTPNIASFFLKVDSTGQIITARKFGNWNIHTLQINNPWQYTISGSYNDSLYPQIAYMVTDANGEGCLDVSLAVTDSPISFATTNRTGFQTFPISIITGLTPAIPATLFEIDVCRYTGVPTPEIQNQSSVKVFPSPASSNLNISSDQIIRGVELMDLHCKTMITLYPQSPSCEMNVSHLPGAIYFLRVTTEEGTSFRKVIIQH